MTYICAPTSANTYTEEYLANAERSLDDARGLIEEMAEGPAREAAMINWHLVAAQTFATLHAAQEAQEIADALDTVREAIESLEIHAPSQPERPERFRRLVGWQG